MMPDMINFVDPSLNPGRQIRDVNDRILRGMDIASATVEPAPAGAAEGGDTAMANILASNEDFNTRYGSLKGWQEAIRKIKPIPRRAAQFSLADIVLAAQAKTTGDAVDLLVKSFLTGPIEAEARTTMVEFLDKELGTSDIARAATYLEEPLRLLAHLIMSIPAYQLC
jgi:hypothetical protein